MDDTVYSPDTQKKSVLDMGAALVPIVPRIYRFSLTLTRSVERAEDLTQSTCLRAMEKRHLFDGVGRLDSWCMAICRSIWLNERRASAIRRTESIDHVSDSALEALVPEMEENIFAAQVLSQVMRLPESQRAAVLLVYGEGYRYSEAARILDVPIGTIMSRLSAARLKLQWMKAHLGSAEKLVKGS